MYNQKYHRFDFLYNHKYGFHINGPRRDAFKAVFRMRPRIVKTLDFSVDVMKRIRREIPDVFLIGRLTVSPQDFGQMHNPHAPMSTRIRQAQKKGREMAERILREEVNQDIHHVNGKPIFSAWESLNEIFPESVSVDEQKLYDEYQLAFGKVIRAAGFEAIGLNFATGNFRGAHLVDNFPGTLESYKYLGFHEYDWPTMKRLHNIGLNESPTSRNIKDRVPEAGEGRGNDGMWLTLRYRRMLFEGVRQKYGDKHTVIITECGMSQGVQGGPDLGPWDPAHPISVDDYWQSLMWYNTELMKDDYVMGACLFVTGAAGNPAWESFEHLGPIMDRLASFQEEIPLSPPAEPATLTEPRAPAKPIDIIKPKPEPESKLKPKAQARAEPEPEPKTEAQAKAEPEPESKAQAKAEPEPKAEAEPELIPDPKIVNIPFSKTVANYHSHYLLFPKGAQDWWYAAARPYLRRFGPTRGESLRDALFLRGQLGHTITCINLSANTIDKIKKYNPGAKLDIIKANTPSDLAAALNERVKQNRPY